MCKEGRMTGFLDSCCTLNYAQKKKLRRAKTNIQRWGEKKHETSTDQPEILADHGRQQSCMEICYQTKTMR